MLTATLALATDSRSAALRSRPDPVCHMHHSRIEGYNRENLVALRTLLNPVSC